MRQRVIAFPKPRSGSARCRRTDKPYILFEKFILTLFPPWRKGLPVLHDRTWMAGREKLTSLLEKF
jgi:hypothetical protein